MRILPRSYLHGFRRREHLLVAYRFWRRLRLQRSFTNRNERSLETLSIAARGGLARDPDHPRRDLRPLPLCGRLARMPAPGRSRGGRRGADDPYVRQLLRHPDLVPAGAGRPGLAAARDHLCKRRF